MVSNFRLVKKLCLLITSTLAAAAVMAMSVTSLVQPPLVAANCTPGMSTDQDTRIIYDGLTGSTKNAMLTDLENKFNSGDGGNCHADLKTVLGTKLGLSDAMLNDTANWSLGYTTVNNANHTSQIATDGGQVVGTDVQILSRCWLQIKPPTNCNPMSAYKLFVDERSGNYLGVYSHAATFYMSPQDKPERTLIHINPSTGVADFAIWTECGNALIFTPKPPVQKLECLQLDMSSDDQLTYNFTVTANRTHLAVDNFYFDFGDNSNKEVATNDSGLNGQITGHVSHTYSMSVRQQQTITAQVYVNKAGQHGKSGVTAATCAKQISPIPAQKSLVCSGLSGTPQDNARSKWIFTASATTTNTTADNFLFDFGDGSTATFPATQTNATTATATSNVHSYQPGDYTIRATVNGPLGKSSTDACVTHIHVPPLQYTGPEGTVGLIAITSTLGVGLHQFILRRKLIA